MAEYEHADKISEPWMYDRRFYDEYIRYKIALAYALRNAKQKAKLQLVRNADGG